MQLYWDEAGLRYTDFKQSALHQTDNMGCGYFTCSKNALISLNILYIVSTANYTTPKLGSTANGSLLLSQNLNDSAFLFCL